jgi:hypothetical protein
MPVMYKDGEIKENQIIVEPKMDQMYIKIESITHNTVTSQSIAN